MAEDKKSFILYADYINLVQKLPDKEAGELFKHILKYVNDQNPITDNFVVEIAFEPIKLQLKRDLKKWDEKRVVKSESGRLGGIKSGEARRKQNEANEANALNLKQNEANEAVTVNVTVTDTVIVTVEEENLPNLNLPTSPFISQYEIITVDEFITHSEKDESWVNSIYEQTRHPDTKRFLPIFATWRKNSKKETATLNDFAKHFSLWIGGAIEREKETLKNATNGRDFKNTAQQLREINKTNPNRHPSASGDEYGGY